jgi:hypothetical protein
VESKYRRPVASTRHNESSLGSHSVTAAMRREAIGCGEISSAPRFTTLQKKIRLFSLAETVPVLATVGAVHASNSKSRAQGTPRPDFASSAFPVCLHLVCFAWPAIVALATPELWPRKRSPVLAVFFRHSRALRPSPLPDGFGIVNSQSRLQPVRGKGLSHLSESLSTEYRLLFCPS